MSKDSELRKEESPSYEVTAASDNNLQRLNRDLRCEHEGMRSPQASRCGLPSACGTADASHHSRSFD